jgi:hypothetical protein
VPLRTIAFSILLCGSLSAAPISQSYLCVQGHEQEAKTKLETFLKQTVTNFFKDRKIAINPSTLEIDLSSSTQTGSAVGPPYVSFTGSASGSSGSAPSSVGATVAAQDGTKFNVLLTSGSDEQNAAEYRIIRTQRGFDKEGNAIGEHCGLELFKSGDSEATESMTIVNAASGHILGRFRLPSRISLY